MTAGDIAMVYDVSVDELLAMQPDEAQWFGTGDAAVFVTKL